MKNLAILLVVILVGFGVYTLLADTRTFEPVDTTEAPSDTGRIRAPEEAVFVVGQQAVVAGVSVTLDEVVDSRCPTGVDCVWAGTLTANVTLGLNGDERAAVLELAMDPVAFGGYLVSLIGAEPYPASGESVSTGDYRLIFRVAPVIGSDGNIPANI